MSALHYQVQLGDVHAHLYRVTLTIAQPAADQELALPVWIPGSYLVREFSKHLQKLRASQRGKPVPLTQRDKARWQVTCDPGAALQLQYEVYAFDNSVRTAWLDATRAFFNGSSLLLQVLGQEGAEHVLDIEAPPESPSWQLATGLSPVRVQRQGFGRYRADDYDALVDCPVEMGPFWSGSFEACGVPHRIVVAGASESFDGDQLLADVQAICSTEIQFWHGAQARAGRASAIPMDRYVFMLNAVGEGYGGLEHRNSTALLCPRKDLPRKPRDTLAPSVHKQPEGYTTLLGLFSHEYFHTWNVKRLRPQEFTRYDYRQENYTELLWFFEGFTSYYDELFLRRSGRIDNAAYLKLLGKTINQVLQTPGRLVQSVAQSSFDAWVKYYRQDENSANATVSYYTKGALVALCLDLTLRAEGHSSLDAVLRALWQRCAGGPMTEQDVLDALHACGKRPYARELARWVHGTADLPLTELLQKHGVRVVEEPNQVAQQLGLRVKEAGGVQITQVLRGGVAEKAGFAAGDEWLAVQAGGARASGPWRMQSLDDLTLYCGNAKSVHATVVRDRRLLTLKLSMPRPSHALRLTVQDGERLQRWLDGS